MPQALPLRCLPARWPLGHLREIRRDMLGFFQRTARECGDVARMQFGTRSVWLVSHPELIEEVLVTKNRSFTKHYALRFLRPVLGEGLLTSETDMWLRQRRLMQPAFAREALTAYGATMVSHARELTDAWRDGQSVDVHRAMSQLTLRVAAKTLMDIDIGGDFDDVCHGMDVMMDDFRRRFQSIWQTPRWLPTPANRRSDRASARLNGVIQRIIANRRAAPHDHGDLLSMLMHARDADDGSRMSDWQLRDEVMTLLLAGHETTANVLTWTWYLLALNPTVESRLESELCEVLGDREPSVADLPRLLYTERVVLESMRLLPPAYTLGREAKEDCVIGDYLVPAGGTLLLSQWVVHHDARWFAEPERFNPDRWTDEFQRTRPKYAYFPFGGGPRVCIGNTFAMMEAVLIIAAIAQRYRLRLASDKPIRPVPAITLRPAGGLPAVVQLRATGNADRTVVVDSRLLHDEARM